jgi:hypothetical protein
MLLACCIAEILASACVSDALLAFPSELWCEKKQKVNDRIKCSKERKSVLESIKEHW